MQAASGQGIISSIVLESDDLDEVDWEFLGGNSTHAETNYFGKGNTTSYDRAIYYPMPDGSDPRTGFHNYTVHWTSDQLQWYIDGTLVRTLPYAAANGGKNYPQTPMTVRLGIWAGGDPDNLNGTIEWAGGLTDFTKGPYTMTVQKAEINDFSTGSAYQWTDKTGDWTSIKSITWVTRNYQIILANISVVETQLPPKPSPKKTLLHSQLHKSSLPFLKAQSSQFTAEAVELQHFFSSPQSSPAFVNAEWVNANAMPTTQRSRRSAKRLTKTRWNCARRASEAGTQARMPSKVTMLSVDGEGLMFHQEQKPRILISLTSKILPM